MTPRADRMAKRAWMSSVRSMWLALFGECEFPATEFGRYFKRSLTPDEAIAEACRKRPGLEQRKHAPVQSW